MTSEFEKSVYKIVKKIPKGKVSTYKEVGKALGGKGQIYRAVGRALKENKLLREQNESLTKQYDQLKKEQISYLQNVSHQLVAPLNAIKWHIENLTAGRLSTTDRIQKVLRSIYSQSTISVHLAKNFG